MPEAEQQQQDPSPADASTEKPETVTEEQQPDSSQEAPRSPKRRRRRDHGGDEKPQEKPNAALASASTKTDEAGARGRAKFSGCSKPPIARLQSLPRSRRRTSSGRMTNTSKRWPTGKTDQRVAESFKRRDAERRQAAEARAIEARRKPGRSARAISAARRRTMTRSSGNRLSRSLRTLSIRCSTATPPGTCLYLAKHPETVKRINALSPLAAREKSDGSEASLSTPPAPQVKPGSKAPAPISPVKHLPCGCRFGICKHGPIHCRASQTRRDLQAPVIIFRSTKP